MAGNDEGCGTRRHKRCRDGSDEKRHDEDDFDDKAESQSCTREALPCPCGQLGALKKLRIARLPDQVGRPDESWAGPRIMASRKAFAAMGSD